MAQYVLLKFKINNDFSEQEETFYNAHPYTRKLGINSIFHSHNVNDKKTLMVLMTVNDKKKLGKFF